MLFLQKTGQLTLGLYRKGTSCYLGLQQNIYYRRLRKAKN